MKDQEIRAKNLVEKFLCDFHRAAKLSYKTRFFAFKVSFIKSTWKQIKQLREIRRMYLKKVFDDELNQCKNLCINILDRKKNKPKNSDEIVGILYKLQQINMNQVVIFMEKYKDYHSYIYLVLYHYWKMYLLRSIITFAK